MFRGSGIRVKELGLRDCVVGLRVLDLMFRD